MIIRIWLILVKGQNDSYQDGVYQRLQIGTLQQSIKIKYGRSEQQSV